MRERKESNTSSQTHNAPNVFAILVMDSKNTSLSSLTAWWNECAPKKDIRRRNLLFLSFGVITFSFYDYNRNIIPTCSLHSQGEPTEKSSPTYQQKINKFK